MDEDPLRRLRDVRRAIYSERDRRLAEAWKAPLKQESNLAILIREPSVPNVCRASDDTRGHADEAIRVGSIDAVAHQAAGHSILGKWYIVGTPWRAAKATHAARDEPQDDHP